MIIKSESYKLLKTQPNEHLNQQIEYLRASFQENELTSTPSAFTVLIGRSYIKQVNGYLCHGM